MKQMIHSSQAQDTRLLAQRCAAVLQGGEVLFLYGPIGAGKTVFVKGLADALGMPSSPTSASFSLMKRYRKGKKVLYHLDLFRLEENEIFNLGLEEILEEEKAIIVVEWPQAARRMFPPDRLEMEFVLAGGDERCIYLRSGGAVSARLAEQLCQKSF